MLTPRELKQLSAAILAMRGPNLAGAGWCVDRLEVVKLLGLYTEPEMTVAFTDSDEHLSVTFTASKEPANADH